MKEYVDRIIKENGIKKYENLVSSGIDNFILNSSEKILKLQDNISNDTLKNLLYLLKYIYQKWSDPQKTSRINKQQCMKVLFVALLTDKEKSEWCQLVNETVKKISENWELSPRGYPFLKDEEINRIVSLYHAKTRKDAQLACLFDNTRKDDIFHFVPKRICNDFKKIYNNTIKNYNPLISTDDTEYIKSIFIAIHEKDFAKEFPAILKILPLQFCLIELHKKLEQIPRLQDDSTAECIVSEKNITLQYEKKLFFKNQKSGNYEPVPQWAEWFFLAGQKLAATTADFSGHVVLGFSLPTTAYASLFFLLGYETWNSEEKMKQGKANTKYFQEISACKEGEALLIMENYHWKRCWFKGVERIGKDQCIKVDVPGATKKKHINYVPESNIAKLRKAVDPERDIAENQIGFKTTGIDSLANYYKKNENKILQLLIQEQVSYLLLGNISLIKKQIDHEKLYIQLNEEYKEISFQHILRFNNFMTDFDLPKGVIVSSQGFIDIHSNSMKMVLYDGSAAFINHQQTIPGNIEVIFLDRTDPQFSNACGELMPRYIDREKDIHLFDHQLPDSVELIAFKE